MRMNLFVFIAQLTWSFSTSIYSLWTDWMMCEQSKGFDFIWAFNNPNDACADYELYFIYNVVELISIPERLCILQFT